jgi:vacuolar-type H+-ATPase catalytic subunit A/Vma1
VNALDRTKKWQYTPDTSVKMGDAISGGQIFGHVVENSLISYVAAWQPA